MNEILGNIETIVEKALQFYDKKGSDELDLLRHYLLKNESLNEEVVLLKQQAAVDAEAVVTAQVKLLDNVHLREIIDNLQRQCNNLSDQKLKIEESALQEILHCRKLQKDAELRYSNAENEFNKAINERASLLQSIRSIDSAETRMQELTGNLEALLETKKGLELRVVELSDLLTQACNEKESLSVKLCNHEKDRTEFNEMESSLLVIAQQKRMLEARTRELEIEVANNSKIKVVVDKKYHEAQSSCLKFQEIEKKLEKEIEKLQQECLNTQQYSNQLQCECDKLMIECSGKDSEISDLKVQVSLLEDECNTVLKQLMETRDAIVNASEDGHDSSAEILMLRQSLSIAADKHDQLKNSIKEILAEKEQQYRQLLARVPVEIENLVTRQLDIESLEAPIVIIQLGYSSTKLYTHSTTDCVFEQMYTCPTIIAKSKRPSSTGDHGDLVKNASFQADSMYQYYRENGYFIGNDAEFCLTQHPDGGLRGLLHEVSILSRDGHLLNTSTGTPITVNHVIRLIQYVLQKGLGVSNLSTVQLVFATKAIYDRNDYLNLAQILYLYLNAQKVCLLDECYLSSTLLNVHAKSYVIVDIGSYYTTIAPYYEGFVLKNSIKQTSLGGESCTQLYEQMLYRQQIAYYSSTTPAKRTSIARFVKEQSIFIVPDFEKSKKEYGEFEHEKITVLGITDNSESAFHCNGFATDSVTTIEANKARKSITKSVSLCTPESTTTATINVDFERFYGGEVLFSPQLFFHEATGLDSVAITPIHSLLVAVVESIDQCVREEMCTTILITGGSACIPGLNERIIREIRPHMIRLGVETFNVVTDTNSARLETLSSRIATNQLDKGMVFLSKDYDSLGDEVFCDPMRE